MSIDYYYFFCLPFSKLATDFDNKEDLGNASLFVQHICATRQTRTENLVETNRNKIAI